jgi:putative membrane protein
MLTHVETEPEHAPGPKHRRTSIPGNLVRGALIGVVETVPGVSGGTVALVVGIYHDLIDSASHLISALRIAVTGPERGIGVRQQLGLVRWRVVLPVLLGMVVAVFAVAGPMADAVDAYPVQTRALFFGMVLASVAVPVRMVLHDLERRRALAAVDDDVSHLRLRPWHLTAGAVAAIGTFVLVSLPPTSVQAHPAVIVPAAAVAVSALVLPGLSGSFLLLTFGLYEPTLRAVDERDLAYLALFMLGMVIGLAVVVKALKWLLEHWHILTLTVLTGVMAGGLRVLWPWQDEQRVLHGPGGDLGPAIGLASVGFLVVAALVVLDSWMLRRHQRAEVMAEAT